MFSIFLPKRNCEVRPLHSYPATLSCGVHPEPELGRGQGGMHRTLGENPPSPPNNPALSCAVHSDLELCNPCGVHSIYTNQFCNPELRSSLKTRSCYPELWISLRTHLNPEQRSSPITRTVKRCVTEFIQNASFEPRVAEFTSNSTQNSASDFHL